MTSACNRQHARQAKAASRVIGVHKHVLGPVAKHENQRGEAEGHNEHLQCASRQIVNTNTRQVTQFYTTVVVVGMQTKHESKATSPITSIVYWVEKLQNLFGWNQCLSNPWNQTRGQTQSDEKALQDSWIQDVKRVAMSCSPKWLPQGWTWIECTLWTCKCTRTSHAWAIRALHRHQHSSCNFRSSKVEAQTHTNHAQVSDGFPKYFQSTIRSRSYLLQYHAAHQKRRALHFLRRCNHNKLK